jgi:hypothetical protein
MLESLIFYKMDVLIRTTKIILLIKKLHSTSLERNMGDVGAKNGHYLMFLIGFWQSK